MRWYELNPDELLRHGMSSKLRQVSRSSPEISCPWFPSLLGLELHKRQPNPDLPLTIWEISSGGNWKPPKTSKDVPLQDTILALVPTVTHFWKSMIKQLVDQISTTESSVALEKQSGIKQKHATVNLQKWLQKFRGNQFDANYASPRPAGTGICGKLLKTAMID